MIVLKNQATGKTLKLKDKDAKEIFGIEGQKHAHLVCLPAQNIIPSLGNKNVQIVHLRKRAKKIGGTCVIRMGGLGDLIMLSSSLVKLKMKNQDKLLTLATAPQFVPIMKKLKGVDLCISIDDIPKYSFDNVIDLRYAVEPPNIGPGSLSWRRYVGFDRSDNFDLLLGVNSNKRYFNVPVNTKACADLRHSALRKPLIVFCPTTASTARTIPPEYVGPIVNKLHEAVGGTVILVGKSEVWNRELTKIQGKHVVNWLDQTSEEELIAVCSMSDMVISPDTGVLHVAGALKKKAVGVFGNINPLTRVSYYPTVKALYPVGKIPCIPCHDVPGACDSDKPGSPCMKLNTPEKIVRAAKELLC